MKEKVTAQVAVVTTGSVSQQCPLPVCEAEQAFRNSGTWPFLFSWFFLLFWEGETREVAIYVDKLCSLFLDLSKKYFLSIGNDSFCQHKHKETNDPHREGDTFLKAPVLMYSLARLFSICDLKYKYTKSSKTPLKSQIPDKVKWQNKLAHEKILTLVIKA